MQGCPLRNNREMFTTHVLACDQVSFDLPAFEQTLRKWGVKAPEAVSLMQGSWV